MVQFKRVIHCKDGSDYLHRWFIIPRNRFFNIYLHRFVRSDDDRALHDHPWWSLGIILKGSYTEHLFGGSKERRAFIPVLRKPAHAHRVELHSTQDYKLKPVWTLFITGPRLRDWGFYADQGWMDHETFLKLYGPQ